YQMEHETIITNKFSDEETNQYIIQRYMQQEHPLQSLIKEYKQKMMDQLVRQAESDCTKQFEYRKEIVEANQRQELEAVKTNRIRDTHFHSTSGYGYDDMGREGLEAVYADVFGGEDALGRPQIVSGTHAISTALFGLLRPGDELLYITGKPYDTLEEVIGKRGNNAGSLKDY